MLKPFLQLLGGDVTTLRRYGFLASFYGVLCGVTIVTLVPVLSALLRGNIGVAGLWLAVLLVEVIGCWGMRRSVEKAGIRVGIAVLQQGRHRLGDHVARLPIGWFTPQHTARLSHLASQGMMEIAQLPAHVLTPLLTGVLTPMVIVIALLIMNTAMGLIALAILPVLALVFMVTARQGQNADQGFQVASADASQCVIEFAQSQSMLRAFNGEEGGTRRVELAIGHQQAASRRLIHVSAMSVVVNSWAVQIGFAALLACACFWLTEQLDHGQEPARLIAVVITLLLTVRFIDPLLDVVGYSEVIRGARGQLRVVSDVFAVPVSKEPDSPGTPVDASVELRDVSFAYDPDQPAVVQDITLRIEPASMTALVGASGSGKTTLMRLMGRFFDVTQGRIDIGGVDVRQLSSAVMAGQISQIFQDAYLLQGSIAENIRLGKPDATDTEVMDAAHQAGVVEILNRLPQGLATQVGEGGALLSGGERQRICIARALIKDAPILLVDEATAALDTENQAVITAALARLRGKRTLIVIAHQLSTIAMADQIVVLDKGRIAECGSHQHLSTLNGLYARFIARRHQALGWRITDAQTSGGDS